MIGTIRLSLGALALVALGLATPASAAQVPFTGTLSVTFRDTGAAPTVQIFTLQGSGVATVGTGGAGIRLASSLTIPAGAFHTVLNGTTTISNRTVAVSVATDFGGCERDGVFEGGDIVLCYNFPSGLAGFGSLRGQLPAPGNLVIPLTGVGGAASVTATYGITGEGWGTAGALVKTNSPDLGLIYTIVYTPTTDAPGGFNTDTLSLTSPFRIAAPNDTSSPIGFARLSIHLVPEPGTLLLLGSGVVGVAAYGARRRKSQL